MEKVLGIGGLFFRARDPVAVCRRCTRNIFTLAPSTCDDVGWQQEAGLMAFSPFPEASEYFGNSKQTCMVNFRVRDSTQWQRS